MQAQNWDVHDLESIVNYFYHHLRIPYYRPRAIKKLMHQPGIEPGSVPWQGTILPLDHWCFDEMFFA